MFRRKPSRPQNRIDSLIGVGTRLEGGVSFRGGLRVDGEIVGNVTSLPEEASTLVLSEKALIEGEIRVSHLVVNGTINGPVHATEFLELQPQSRVKGDVHYRTLEMHLGAIVEGRLVHCSGEDRAAGADPKAGEVELKLASSRPSF